MVQKREEMKFTITMKGEERAEGWVRFKMHKERGESYSRSAVISAFLIKLGWNKSGCYEVDSYQDLKTYISFRIRKINLNG